MNNYAVFFKAGLQLLKKKKQTFYIRESLSSCAIRHTETQFVQLLPQPFLVYHQYSKQAYVSQWWQTSNRCLSVTNIITPVAHILYRLQLVKIKYSLFFCWECPESPQGPPRVPGPHFKNHRFRVNGLHIWTGRQAVGLAIFE